MTKNNIYNKNSLYLFFQYYHKKENYYYRDFYENDEYIKKLFEEKNLEEQIYNYLRLIRINSLENITLKNFFYLVLNKKKNITIFDEFLIIKTLFFSISYIKINCDFPIKKIYSTLKINCQPKNLSDTILKLTSELILYVDNFKDFLFDN